MYNKINTNMIVLEIFFATLFFRGGYSSPNGPNFETSVKLSFYTKTPLKIQQINC